MRITNYPKRKQLRLPDFDYSSYGAYFITICTGDRNPILSEIEKTESNEASVSLSSSGEIVQRFIMDIPKHYEGVSLPSFIIMPDHIHLIILIDQNGKPTSVPQIIKAFKRLTAKALGVQIWQESYYDHIIRNEIDLQTKIEYIETNPLRRLLKMGIL